MIHKIEGRRSNRLRYKDFLRNPYVYTDFVRRPVSPWLLGGWVTKDFPEWEDGQTKQQFVDDIRWGRTFTDEVTIDLSSTHNA